MDFARRGPLGQKKAKKTRKTRRARAGHNDPEYLAQIHDLPCAACVAGGEQQTSPTRAHHTFCGRFSQARSPDADAIPLCDDHHQGGRGGEKLAIHEDKAAWVERYGPDTGFIEATRAALGRT